MENEKIYVLKFYNDNGELELAGWTKDKQFAEKWVAAEVSQDRFWEIVYEMETYLYGI